MTFNIDGQKIPMPEVAIQDYENTMKRKLTANKVAVYVGIAGDRNPGVKDDELLKGAVEELYNEISQYDTYVGRHYGA